MENTGWAKPGYENYYNVYIMDESHTILACGAGAVSKIKHPYKDELQRIFNFKFPYEYIDRYQEMLDRKEKVKSIYKEFLLSSTPSTNLISIFVKCHRLYFTNLTYIVLAWIS